MSISFSLSWNRNSISLPAAFSPFVLSKFYLAPTVDVPMQDQMFAGIRVQVLTLGTKYLFHYMSNLSTIFLSHLYAPPPPPPHSARNSICRCSMNNPSTMQRLPLPTRLRCRQPVSYLAFSSSTLHELFTCTSQEKSNQLQASRQRESGPKTKPCY